MTSHPVARPLRLGVAEHLRMRGVSHRPVARTLTV